MELYARQAAAILTDIAQVAIVFMLLALVVKRGAVLASWRRCREEFMTNLSLLLLNGVFLAPLLVLPANLFHAQLHALPGAAAFWNGLFWPLTLLAALLMNELAVYWRHRWEHGGMLWRFHATHHSDEAIHWLSVMRKHPVGRLIDVTLDSIPMIVLGFPLWAIVGAGAIRSWWGYFIHTDVPWTLGPVGAVMISPAAHRLHHARDEALAGTNFGGLFTLWDRLFGTYCPPDAHLNCPTGIAEGTRSFLGEVARPLEGLKLPSFGRRRAV